MADGKRISRRGFLKSAAATAAGLYAAGEAGADPKTETAAGGAPMSYQLESGEPYELLGKRLVFTNWLFVRQGTFAWIDASGKNVSVKGSEGPWGASFTRSDFPHGIKLTARRSKQISVTLRPGNIGGDAHPGFTLMKDGAVYRAWEGDHYFESDDGYNWKAPKLGIAGAKDDNQLSFSLGGGTVFLDPAGPPEERYKWVVCDTFSDQQVAELKKKRPLDWEPRAFRKDVGHAYGVGGAVSPDGIKWTKIPEPLVIEHTDTQVTGYYDRRLKRYVVYTRTYSIWPRSGKFQADPNQQLPWWNSGRRAIGRTESEDFRRFPVSEVILEPSPSMAPSDLLYTNCYTTIPGAPDLHLMFPALWTAAKDDTTSHLLASSIDGRVWNYVPGPPVIETANFGEWDGGCIFALPNLVELADGDWALPYTGYNFPHKYPRGQLQTRAGYALWPKGRLIALEADELGEFATVGIIPPGRKLRINAVTKRAGSIRVEVAGMSGQAIAGRSFEDSAPIAGDQFKAPVTWKGGDDLGHKEGDPIVLRFKMDRAQIFGLDFE